LVLQIPYFLSQGVARISHMTLATIVVNVGGVLKDNTVLEG